MMHAGCYQETLASSGYKNQRRNRTEGDENGHKRKIERGRVEGREEERQKISQRKIQDKKSLKKRSKAEQGDRNRRAKEEKPNGEAENTDSRGGLHHHRFPFSRTRFFWLYHALSSWKYDQRAGSLPGIR
uniref:Uncharacterized protein n=1 Tax=Populus davidiana TaxID=266767 RepID=A0A6M2F1I9_9ROSI